MTWPCPLDVVTLVDVLDPEGPAAMRWPVDALRGSVANAMEGDGREASERAGELRGGGDGDGE